MKALTICQPFASLILTGEKRVENRPKNCRYRGTLVVHAGKSKDWLARWRGAMPDHMPFGAAIGTVEVVDCIDVGQHCFVSKADIAKYPQFENGIHVSGPFCIVLANPRPFATPIPYSGMLGLWDFPDELLPDERRR